QSYRLLRAVKNRYGSTNEIGVVDMSDTGLKEVPNPSEMFLSGRPVGVSGCAIGCVMEGSRPILAEVQALVTKSSYASPRRTSTGFDFSRLAIIIAMLEKRAGIFYGKLDIYVNVVGGFRLDEPAADLPVALALYSSLLDMPIDEKLAAFGEIGLGGEVRNISNISQRINEAARLGFTKVIVPKTSLRTLDPKAYDISIIGVSNIKQAFNYLKKLSGRDE
ncbi:MAG: DNA repair protein RadA, partial [Ruminococcus sp.]|nr:DNA repair protein RadA [Ruminococcus sp.]